MPNFKANLIRERFVLTNKKNTDAPTQIALGNRLEFQCFSASGEKSAKFIVRAQNIHTTLRIAARLARHWYDHGSLESTGRNRFNWNAEYKDTIKDFEEKWNKDCWACVYKNGQRLFGPDLPEKSQLFDIIEQVYAYTKGDYKNITAHAEKMFAEAGKEVSIDYDRDIAMQLAGSDKEVQNKVTYRDTDGRNKIDLLMRQKDLRYVSGEGTPIKLSECLSVAAVIFEGYQLGFIAGRVNYMLAAGQMNLSDPDAQQADHAIKRVIRLDGALIELAKKHHLAFKPKPNFQNNINKIENSFRQKARTF